MAHGTASECGDADRCHEAHELRIQQWKFGAVSPKPTTIRTLGLPHLGAQFRACEIPGVAYPRAVLGGKSADGSFRTAAAKEYPPGLCRALITAGVCGLRRRHIREGIRRIPAASFESDALEWLCEMSRASSHECTASTFKLDYQPTM